MDLAISFPERGLHGLDQPCTGTGLHDETVQKHQKFGHVPSPRIDLRDLDDLLSPFDPAEPPRLELHHESAQAGCRHGNPEQNVDLLPPMMVQKIFRDRGGMGAFYLFPAFRTDDLADPREEQPKVVVDLGNGADRGT